MQCRIYICCRILLVSDSVVYLFLIEMILLGICQRGKNMYKQGIPTKKEAKTKKAHKAWTQLPPMTANQTRNIFTRQAGVLLSFSLVRC